MMAIHGDTEEDWGAERFKRFLWDNLFFNCEVADGKFAKDASFYESTSGTGGSTPPNLPPGTYHEHYYISANLFAVGVMEILPTCINSVSFFYDPDYIFLNPGTFSALREINFVNELAKVNPQMEYYLLGGYIHCCPKIKYKSRFKPCQLRCPVTNEWVDFDERVSSLLDSVDGGIVKLKEEVELGMEIKNLKIENQIDGDEMLLEKVLYKGRIRKVKEFLCNINPNDIYGEKVHHDADGNSIKLDQIQLEQYYLNMFKSYVKSVGPTITANMWIYVNRFEMF